MDQLEQIERIKTREDLSKFVSELANECRQGPEDWENTTLASYLEALAAWIAAMDGYFLNQKQAVPERPEWKTLAQMLAAACFYE